MEITEQEYYELKAQVELLKQKVDGVKKPRADFASLVMEKPISYVRNIEDSLPVFDYKWSASGDEWTLFLRLAKIIHRPNNLFYMDSCTRGPYIRSIKKGCAPRKFTEMTEEQIELSVQMLNELIPIYNKYYKEIHPAVLYDADGNGLYKNVNVIKIDK